MSWGLFLTPDKHGIHKRGRKGMVLKMTNYEIHQSIYIHLISKLFQNFKDQFNRQKREESKYQHQ